MADDPPPVILSPAEAKKRFALYLAVKLLGYAAMLGGVFLLSRGVTAIAVIIVIAGGTSLLIRPRNLGLTTKPPK
jgi:hypothetical protein